MAERSNIKMGTKNAEKEEDHQPSSPNKDGGEVDDKEDERNMPAGLPKGEETSLYMYRDFSNVGEDELEEIPASTAPLSRSDVETSIRVQKFPVKLYAILAQKEFSEIITWMPHGRSWKVLKPQSFETIVMPLFFEYSNYHSFNRLVNAWSFRRISTGPDRGSYYHELFLRGRPHLQKFMRRLPKTHKKLPMKKENEPDFYDTNKIAPLPSLDESPLPATSIMPPLQKANLILKKMQPPVAGLRDPLESREPLIGLGGAPSTSFGLGSQLGGLGSLSGMGGFGGMGLGAGISMGGIGAGLGFGLGGGLSAAATLHSLGAMGGRASGIGAALRESQMATAGLLNLSANMGPSALGSPSLDRLRRLQELQALEMERQAMELVRLRR